MRYTTTLLAALLFLSPAPGLAALGDCGQPISTGAQPTASDALVVLRVAIGAETCDPSVCDVDATCTITATDALRLLQHAINPVVTIDCDGACGGTTTSSSLLTTTSSTSTSSSTSTTLAAAGTWTEVIGVFARNGCSALGCHGTFTLESGDLGSLDDFDAGYDELVDAAVFCAPATFTSRVVPGDPDASFLLDKLNLTPDCGLPMPVGVDLGVVPPVSPEDVEIIRSWIASGAPKN